MIEQQARRDGGPRTKQLHPSPSPHLQRSHVHQDIQSAERIDISALTIPHHIHRSNACKVVSMFTFDEYAAALSEGIVDGLLRCVEQEMHRAEEALTSTTQCETRNTASHRRAPRCRPPPHRTRYHFLQTQPSSNPPHSSLHSALVDIPGPAQKKKILLRTVSSGADKPPTDGELGLEPSRGDLFPHSTPVREGLIDP